MNKKGEGKYLIVVPPHAAKSVSTHMKIYGGKELLVPVENIEGVAEYLLKRRWDEENMINSVDNLLMSLGSTFVDPTAHVSRR